MPKNCDDDDDDNDNSNDVDVEDDINCCENKIDKKNKKDTN